MVSVKNDFYFSIIIISMTCGCKENSNSFQKISYYKNGNILSIKTYGKDKITHQEIWFNSLGSVQEISQYKNNTQNGESYYYYPNGLIKSQRTWRDNKKVGYGNDYYPYGRTEVKVLYWYNNDTIQYYKCFDENGRVTKEKGNHPSLDDYINLYFPKK